MKTPERLFCCTTCTTTKKQRIISALTGIGKKYTTYTIAIPPKPRREKSKKSGTGGLGGTGAIPTPIPATSHAVRGLSEGGTGGTAKIDFFLLFYFRRNY